MQKHKLSQDVIINDFLIKFDLVDKTKLEGRNEI